MLPQQARRRDRRAARKSGRISAGTGQRTRTTAVASCSTSHGRSLVLSKSPLTTRSATPWWFSRRADVEVPDPAQLDPVRNPDDLDGSGEVSDVGVGERTVGIEDHDDARSGSDESADLGSQPPLHVVIRTTSRSRAPGRVKPASPEIRAAA